MKSAASPTVLVRSNTTSTPASASSMRARTPSNTRWPNTSATVLPTGDSGSENQRT